MSELKTCPKCHSPASSKAEYCVCGHKFEDVTQKILDMLKGGK